ncbi:hypothetical protein SNEBB_003480 [Seison nebaliae]|nr:hypothetical protein SNEBB_003480 [Seison nebaliae]
MKNAKRKEEKLRVKIHDVRPPTSLFKQKYGQKMSLSRSQGSAIRLTDECFTCYVDDKIMSEKDAKSIHEALFKEEVSEIIKQEENDIMFDENQFNVYEWIQKNENVVEQLMKKVEKVLLIILVIIILSFSLCSIFYSIYSYFTIHKKEFWYKHLNDYEKSEMLRDKMWRKSDDYDNFIGTTPIAKLDYKREFSPIFTKPIQIYLIVMLLSQMVVGILLILFIVALSISASRHKYEYPATVAMLICNIFIIISSSIVIGFYEKLNHDAKKFSRNNSCQICQEGLIRHLRPNIYIGMMTASLSFFLVIPLLFRLHYVKKRHTELLQRTAKYLMKHGQLIIFILIITSCNKYLITTESDSDDAKTILIPQNRIVTLNNEADGIVCTAAESDKPHEITWSAKFASNPTKSVSLHNNEKYEITNTSLMILFPSEESNGIYTCTFKDVDGTNNFDFEVTYNGTIYSYSSSENGTASSTSVDEATTENVEATTLSATEIDFSAAHQTNGEEDDLATQSSKIVEETEAATTFSSSQETEPLEDYVNFETTVSDQPTEGQTENSITDVTPIDVTESDNTAISTDDDSTKESVTQSSETTSEGDASNATEENVSEEMVTDNVATEATDATEELNTATDSLNTDFSLETTLVTDDDLVTMENLLSTEDDSQTTEETTTTAAAPQLEAPEIELVGLKNEYNDGENVDILCKPIINPELVRIAWIDYTSRTIVANSNRLYLPSISRNLYENSVFTCLVMDLQSGTTMAAREIRLPFVDRRSPQPVQPQQPYYPQAQTSPISVEFVNKEDVSLTSGDRLALDCVASGSQELISETVIKRRSGKPTGGVNQSRPYWYRLIVDNVQKSNAGEYICETKLTNGQVQTTITKIYVDGSLGDPVTTVRPNNVRPSPKQDLDIKISSQKDSFGDNDGYFYLDCLPTSGFISLRWERPDLRPIREGVNATSRRLIVPNPQPQDAGTYVCVAVDPNGVEHKNSHQIRYTGQQPEILIEPITAPPTPTPTQPPVDDRRPPVVAGPAQSPYGQLQTQQYIVNAGEPVDAIFTELSGSSPLTFDVHPMKDESQRKMLHPPQNKILRVFDNVQPSDSGVYQLNMNNPAGKYYVFFRLIVNDDKPVQPPQPTGRPDKHPDRTRLQLTSDVPAQSAPEPNEKFVLYAYVSGPLVSAPQWLFNNQETLPSGVDVIRSYEKPMLIIERFSPDLHNGVYLLQCQGDGSVERKEFYVRGRPQQTYTARPVATRNPPVVENRDIGLTVSEGGSNTVFINVVSGEQPMVYEWSKHGQPIADPDLDVNKQTFRINNADPEKHSGSYDLVIGNAVGRTNVRVNVIVNAPNIGMCSDNEQTCNNRQCVPKEKVCNGFNDCSDGSDEWHCHQSKGNSKPFGAPCEPNEFKCSNKSQCYVKFWRCDGEADCEDASDELNCELNPPQQVTHPDGTVECAANQWRCADKRQCIQRGFWCDQSQDCADASDEINCRKPEMIEPPQRVTFADIGETVVLTCRMSGTPHPYINWRLNWGHVCEEPRCKITQSGNGIGSLTINDVQAGDMGAYSCEGMNSYGVAFARPDGFLNVTNAKTCPEGSHIFMYPNFKQECVACRCSGMSSSCRIMKDMNGHPSEQCQCPPAFTGNSCERCQPDYYKDQNGYCVYGREQPVQPVTSRPYVPVRPQPSISDYSPIVSWTNVPTTLAESQPLLINVEIESNAPVNQYWLFNQQPNEGQWPTNVQVDGPTIRIDNVQPQNTGEYTLNVETTDEIPEVYNHTFKVFVLPEDSTCEPDGTTSINDDYTCNCKENTEGMYCSRCKEGTFLLDSLNPKGCQECYCSGVSNNCEVAAVYRSDKPIIQDGANLETAQLHHLPEYSVVRENVKYVKVPDENSSTMSGNHIYLYGGKIKADTEIGDGAPADVHYQRDIYPLMIIRTNDNNGLLEYRDLTLLKSFEEKYVIPINEGEAWFFKSKDGKYQQANRAQIMKVLGNIKDIYFRTSLTPQEEQKVLLMTFPFVENTPTVNGYAKGIEKCTCPLGYAGLSCETCADGFTKDLNGKCTKCDCNGHANQCDVTTNKCVGCQNNRMGDHCEQCLPGFVIQGDNCVYNVITQPPVQQIRPIAFSIQGASPKDVNGRTIYYLPIHIDSPSHYKIIPNTNEPLNYQWGALHDSLPEHMRADGPDLYVDKGTPEMRQYYLVKITNPSTGQQESAYALGDVQQPTDPQPTPYPYRPTQAPYRPEPEPYRPNPQTQTEPKVHGPETVVAGKDIRWICELPDGNKGVWNTDDFQLIQIPSSPVQVYNEQLIIRNISENYHGVVVKCGNGKEFPKIFPIIVNLKEGTGKRPIIFTKDVSSEEEPNEDFNVLFCQAIGNPLPELHWTMTGHDNYLPQGITIDTIPNDDESISKQIKIPAKESMTGNYSCVAENEFGSERKTAAIGSVSTSMVCSQEKFDNAVRYSWQAVDTQEEFETDTAVLTLPSQLTRPIYTCQVKDNSGRVLAMNTILNLQDSVVLQQKLIQPKISQVPIGSKVTLSCYTNMDNQLDKYRFKWLRADGKEWNQDAQLQENTLFIPEFRQDDAGKYKCEMRLLRGSDDVLKTGGVELIAIPQGEIIVPNVQTTTLRYVEQQVQPISNLRVEGPETISPNRNGEYDCKFEPNQNIQREWTTHPEDCADISHLSSSEHISIPFNAVRSPQCYLLCYVNGQRAFLTIAKEESPDPHTYYQHTTLPPTTTIPTEAPSVRETPDPSVYVPSNEVPLSAYLYPPDVQRGTMGRLVCDDLVNENPVQWSKPTGSTGEGEPTVGRAILTFSKLSEVDSGEYTCYEPQTGRKSSLILSPVDNDANRFEATPTKVGNQRPAAGQTPDEQTVPQPHNTQQLVPPTITIYPEQPEEGQEIMLRCETTNPSARTSYTWRRQRGSVDAYQKRGNILRIDRATMNDNDQFICIITNDEGSVESSINVQISPSYRPHPQQYQQTTTIAPLRKDIDIKMVSSRRLLRPGGTIDAKCNGDRRHTRAKWTLDNGDKVPNRRGRHHRLVMTSIREKDLENVYLCTLLDKNDPTKEIAKKSLKFEKDPNGLYHPITEDVVVENKPEFESIRNESVNLGQMLKLKCNPEELLPFTEVSWDVVPRSASAMDNELIIDSLQSEDESTIICHYETDDGKAHKHKINLKVRDVIPHFRGNGLDQIILNSSDFSQTDFEINSKPEEGGLLFYRPGDNGDINEADFQFVGIDETKNIEYFQRKDGKLTKMYALKSEGWNKIRILKNGPLATINVNGKSFSKEINETDPLQLGDKIYFGTLPDNVDLPEEIDDENYEKKKDFTGVISQIKSDGKKIPFLNAATLDIDLTHDVCANVECENNGKCIQTSDSVEGFVCECDSNHVGRLCENPGRSCSSISCNSSPCVEDETGQAHCLCKLDQAGDNCEYPNDGILRPKFNKRSVMAYDIDNQSDDFKFDFSYRPENTSSNTLLAYISEDSSSSQGDFFALYTSDSNLMISYDCGEGVETLSFNEKLTDMLNDEDFPVSWYRVEVGKESTKMSLTVNGKKVEEQMKNECSFDFDNILYVGGKHPEKQTTPYIPNDLDGFVGCMTEFITINGNKLFSSDGIESESLHIKQCGSVSIEDRCDMNPCMNGGTCSQISISVSCDCPQNFQGAFCEILIDTPSFICTSDEDCLNGGRCENVNGNYICVCSGNNVGPQCENSVPLSFDGERFKRLAKRNFQQNFANDEMISIVFRPEKSLKEGLIFWWGNKATNGKKDFLAIGILSDGRIKLHFNSGNGEEQIVSKNKIHAGRINTLSTIRNSHHATLMLNNREHSKKLKKSSDHIIDASADSMYIGGVPHVVETTGGRWLKNFVGRVVNYNMGSQSSSSSNFFLDNMKI